MHSSTISASALTIHELPNEILVSILSAFRTHQLLPLTLVSQRFHTLILRILHFRLLLAAAAPEYKIILEAYLPSRRWDRPYLFCTYLGTNGLSSRIEGKGSLYEDCVDETGRESICGRLAKLGGLYSRFRPELPGVDGTMPVRRIAGAAPNLASNTSGLNMWYSASDSSTGPASASAAAVVGDDASAGDAEALDGNGAIDAGTGQQTEAHGAVQAQGLALPLLPSSTPIWANSGDGGTKKVIYQLHVDAEELFSQFCAAASLVRLGPRRGVFLSSVPIVEDKQGVIRVWRNWLLDRSEEHQPDETLAELHRTATDLRSEDIAKDKSVLWTSYSRNVGLKLGIKEKPLVGISSPSSKADKEDIPLSFDIEIQELIVRTTHLMLAVEDSEEVQRNPGKALIFGNFAVAS